MDSQSLRNSTLAPGWRPDEVAVLKVALMKYGIGRWKKIMQSGFLPGKTPSQLSSQTQRLLGQQSLAEYLHLHLDIDMTAAYNAKRTGVKRKSNCIINTGNNPDPKELERLREFNQERFGLTAAQINELAIPRISTLSRKLSVQGDSITRLEQLYSLKEHVEQKLRKLKK